VSRLLSNRKQMKAQKMNEAIDHVKQLKSAELERRTQAEVSPEALPAIRTLNASNAAQLRGQTTPWVQSLGEA